MACLFLYLNYAQFFFYALLQSEYIYNFDELCAVIDTIEALHPKHKVWFKEVPDMPNTWEVNFEELL